MLKSTTITKQTALATTPVLRGNRQSKIALPTSEGLRFEKIDTITHLKAAGNYTYIYFGKEKKILVCKTLNEMSNRLGQPYRFVRIHRSSIINLEFLNRYVKGKGGYVVMENGTSMAVSSTRKQTFFDALKYSFR